MKKKDFLSKGLRLMVMPDEYSDQMYKVCIVDDWGNVDHDSIQSDVPARDLSAVVDRLVLGYYP